MSKIKRATVMAIFFLVCLSAKIAQASYFEFFGSAPTQSSLAGQHTGDGADSANNYYAPALLAWNNKVLFTMATAFINTSFKPIDNVTIENTLTNSSEQTGAVDTDYEPLFMGLIHTTLPIKTWGNFALSIATPIGHMLEANSGDPLRPEYVMYRARYNRTLAFANYAHRLGTDWAVSLGAHMGFQTTSNIDNRAVPNGGGTEGSLAAVKAKAEPSLAAVISVAKRWHSHESTTKRTSTTFTFQQESKSHFKASAAGETSNPIVPFQIQIDSMVYFDPHTFRLTHVIDWDRLLVAVGVEYQMWKNFKTPVIEIKKISGVINASVPYEQIQAHNIIVPKLGFLFRLWENTSLSTGLSFRPSVLKGDFSGAGNTLDTDTLIAALGAQWKMNFWGKEMALSAAFQYHHLVEKRVSKTSLQENGSAGNKIGSPGYTLGGNAQSLSLGLSTWF